MLKHVCQVMTQCSDQYFKVHAKNEKKQLSVNIEYYAPITLLKISIPCWQSCRSTDPNFVHIWLNFRDYLFIPVDKMDSLQPKLQKSRK